MSTEPTPKTVKRLFALSGNQCAFPGCVQTLVDGSVVHGEIAHICAESPNGPRYSEKQTADERRSFENLLLLCERHHTDIDNAPTIFTVGVLTEMKQKHEAGAEKRDDGEIAAAANLIIAKDISVRGLNLGTVAGVIQNSTINHNYGSVLVPPQAPMYSGRVPLDGSGRYRAAGRPLGKSRPYEPFGISRGIQPRDIFLPPGACCWLRLRPATLPQKDFNFLDLKNAAGSLLVYALYGTATSSFNAEDALGWFNDCNDSETGSANALFRDGEVWALSTELFWSSDAQMSFGLSEFIYGAGEAFTNAAQVLANLGLSTPYAWELGIEAPTGCRITYNTQRNAFVNWPKLLTGVVVERGAYSDIDDIREAQNTFIRSVFGECAREVPDGLLLFLRA